MASEIEETRSAIEDWVAQRWEQVEGDWTDADASEARNWITDRFPWMSDANVRHAISQATYYAWHG